MKRLLILIIGAVVVVGLSVGAVSQRHYIRDQYVANTSQLDPEAQAVAERLELTDKGMLLFRASRSQMQDAEEFNKSCSGVHRELTIVLGCYANRRIFVFRVTDDRLEGAVEATAAHELLHAVYERLPRDYRKEVDTMLKIESDKINSGRVAETIDAYRQSVPDQLANEIHSILGTEQENLPAKLEQHYAQYFQDRQTVVDYTNQYSEVFAAMESDIKKYDQSLDRLSNNKANLELTLSKQKQQLEDSELRLQRLNQQGRLTEYNRQVTSHNQIVDNYNQTVRSLRELVVEYNQIVDKRNRMVVTQNDLVHTMDSKYETTE